MRSEQQVAERIARELMDMKIEAAHLRERLLLRVGGDTTAAELEAEAFALQKALSEAQQSLKVRETELQVLDHKYQKSLRGMIQLDEAWQLSKTQTREAKDAQQMAERLAADEKRRGDELQHQLEASHEREKKLVSRVDALVQEKKMAQQQRDEKAQEAKDREMQIYELRAQLETTRHQFETQIDRQEGATREDVRRLQKELQKAEEKAAALRGEINARQVEAARKDVEVKELKQAEALTKQRLVKLTEDHATLRVHLDTAKLIAVESTQRAIEAESENECLKTDLEQREETLKEKETYIQALEEDLIQRQRRIEEEMAKKEHATKEIQERLTKESQEVLQAQEDTWTRRESILQQEVSNFQQQLAHLQALHVELAQLLQIKEKDIVDKQVESVEPAMLKALVVQEINQRDVLTTAYRQMKVKIRAAKRQLLSQKQLEVENVKLRAEYEKAKLAMERMAIRKAKTITSVVSSPARTRSGHNKIGSFERTNDENIRLPDEANSLIVKRQLEAEKHDSIEPNSTPRKAQRTKHVYVASRYLSSASKH